MSRWTRAAALIAGLALFVALVAAPSVGLAAVATVQGTVTNSAASSLAGIHVTIEGKTLAAPYWADAVTGPGGTFVFGVPEIGDYQVSAVDPGGVYLVASKYLSGVSTGIVTADLTMFRPGGLSGTVTDALTAAPLQHVEVQSNAITADFEYWDGTGLTDQYGDYSISGAFPGPHAIYFYDRGGRATPYAPQWYSGALDFGTATLVTIAEDLITPNINAALSTDTVLGGRVTDAGIGIPLGMTVIQVQNDLTADLAWTTTSADGTYVLAGLPAGDYTVSAQSPLDDYVNYSQTVTLLDNQVLANVDFAMTPAAVGHMTGRTVVAPASPFGGIQVSLAMGLPADNLPVEFSTVTAGDGTFSLPPRTGTITLRFFDVTGAHPELVATVTATGAGALGDFTLTGLGTIAGTVADVNARPLAGAFVFLWRAADPVAPLDSATTGIDGSYSFGELPSGSYRLSFEAETYQTEYYDNAQTFAGSTSLAVAGGTSTADAVLSRPDTLAGMVTDTASLALPGTLVEIWHVGPGGLELAGSAVADVSGGFSIGSLVSGDHVIRLSAGLGAGYVIPGGEWLTPDSALAARYTFADSLSPQTQTVFVRYAFDTAAPVASISVAPASTFPDWYPVSPTVTLSATDVGGSGVASISYTIDGGPTLAYSAPFPVSGEGTHTVSYWATDNVGNVSTALDQAIDIDTVVPVASISVVPASTFPDWYPVSPTVTLSATDVGGSGVASISYTIDGGPVLTYSAPFAVPGEGPHTVSYWATDNVGNGSTPLAQAIDIDTVAPTVSPVAFSAVSNIGDWYSSPMTVTMAASDTGSGIAQILYTVNGGANQVYTAPFTVTASGIYTIEYWAVDNVGHTATHQTATVFVGVDVARVTGTITDSAGPLAGIHVVIQRVSDPSPLDPIAPYWDEVTTGADGTYSFGVPEPGVYSVRVDDPSGAYADMQRLATAVTGTTTVVDFTLGTRGGISGSVVESGTSTPIQMIDVESLQLTGDFQYWDGFTQTDPYGNYSLEGVAPGAHAVNFTDNSDRELPYAGQWFDRVADQALATTVTVTSGVTATGIDAALVADTMISGTVTDSVSGLPLGGIVVQVQDTLSSDLVRTFTAPDGTYRVTGLNPSTYDVIAQSASGDYTNATTTGIILDATQPSMVVDFALVPTAAGHLTGRAVDSTTAPTPLAGIEVGLAMGVPADNLPVEISTVTGADGTFSLPPRTGAITLTFFDPTGAHPTLVTTLVAAGAADLGDFVLGATGTISGSVTDVNGQPLAGTFVRLWNAADPVAPLDSAVVGLSGAYSFGDLAGGSYKVSFDNPAYQSEYFDNALTFASATVITVTDVVETADAVLSKPATISGSITTLAGGPAIGATVRAFRLVPAGTPELAGSAVTDGSGAYSIGGLTTGDYVVQLDGAGIVGYVTVGRQWLTSVIGSAEVFTIPDALDPFTLTVDARLAIDEVPPVVTIALDAAHMFDPFYSDPVTVSIDAVDALSGVDHVLYTVDGGSVTTYTVPFEVPNEGAHTVTAWAVDVAGNESAPVDSAFVIDATGPVVTASAAPAATGVWYPSTAITLAATDTGGSGVANIFYTVNGGAVTTYTAPIPLDSTGHYNVVYWAVDNVANASGHLTLALDVDADAPTIPGNLHWTSIHPTSAHLAWSASSDADSGVARYQVYADGVLLDTVTGTSFAATGLTPNTSVHVTVYALDVVGNRSGAAALDVTTPASEVSTPVPTGAAQTITVLVPFNGSLKPFVFVFDQVTGAGTLTVTPLGTQPSFTEVPGTLRTVGGFYDVSFTGTFTGSVRVTLPYDMRLPDSRATTLKLLRWLDVASPAIVDVTISTTQHTATFTLTELCPIVLAEPVTNSKATHPTATWRGTSSTEIHPRYRGAVYLQSHLRAADGSDLYSGAVVDVQRLVGGVWVTWAQAVRSSSGLYTHKINSPTSLSYWRLSFAGDPLNDPSVSRTMSIKPRVKIYLSSVSHSYRHTTTYTLRGRIFPTHAAGSTHTAYVRLYRYSRGAYRYYKTVHATIGGSGTTFSSRIRLPYVGRWKLVPYAPTDSMHYSTIGSARYAHSR